MLLSSEQLDLLGATIAESSGLDPELISACGPAVRHGRYDDAASSAFKVLEVRMRELLGMKGGTGVQMSERAFGVDGGLLTTNLKLDPPGVEATKDLFVAAFRLFRNPVAHAHQGYSDRQARQIINLVDLLLDVLAKAGEHDLGHPMLIQIQSALGLATSNRVFRFLDQAAAIGIRRRDGKDWVPYKARLRRHVPKSDQVRPHDVTVFWLTIMGTDPQAAFASKQLGQVEGLNLTAFESDLLKAGCQEFAAMDTRVRLPFAERHDEATLTAVLKVIEDHLRPCRA